MKVVYIQKPQMGHIITPPFSNLIYIPDRDVLLESIDGISVSMMTSNYLKSVRDILQGNY